MAGYIGTILQTVLFVGLLPVYSMVYLDLINRLQGLAYPMSLSFKLSIAISHWRHLEFGRPLEALFAISASATTVFAISFLAWWYL